MLTLAFCRKTIVLNKLLHPNTADRMCVDPHSMSHILHTNSIQYILYRLIVIGSLNTKACQLNFIKESKMSFIRLITMCFEFSRFSLKLFDQHQQFIY